MVYSIQFLRYVAASLVVFYHGVIFLAPHITFYASETLYASKLGAAGVHIFFVISGFVMVWTQSDQFGHAKPWAFFQRRVARIYPLYWILALLSAPILFAIERNTPDTVMQWIGAFLLWPSEASKLIFVGWTLTFEVFFYAVFALFLALQWGRLATLIGLSLFFVALVAAGRAIEHDSVSLSFVTNVLLLEFVAGAWIAQILIRFSTLPSWLGWATILAGVAGFLLSAVIGYNRFPSIVIWGVPSILLVFGLVILEQREVGRRFFPRFADAGDASYALYLIHPVLMSPVAFYLMPDSLKFGLVPALLLLIIAYALLFWLSLLINQHLEKPLLTILQRRIALRQTRTG